MKVQTRFEGMDAATKGLLQATPVMERAIAKAIRQGTNKIRASVRKAAPKKARPPHVVRDGVRAEVKGRGVDTVGTTYLKGIALIVAKGAAPHRIAPRNATVLKFGDRFARSVDHPGSRPNDFFDRGVADGIRAIDETLNAVGADVARVVTETR